MDRMREEYVRQNSTASSTGTGTPSGSTSPSLHRHTRSATAGLGNVKRSQQTKAAAAKLARVMAHQQPGDSDDEEDDLDLYDYNPGSASSGLGLVGNRPARSRSPLMSARTSIDQVGTGRSGLGMRPSHSAGSVEQQQTSSRYSSSGRSSHSSSIGKLPSALSVPVDNSFQSNNSAEPLVSPYARSTASPAVGRSSSPYFISGNRSSQSANSAEPLASPYSRPTASPALGRSLSPYSVSGNRSSQSTNTAEPIASPYARPSSPASREQVHTSASMTNLRSFRSNSMEQPLSARGNTVGRPSAVLKPISMVPSAVPVTLKTGSSGAAAETQPDFRKEKKLSVEFGTFKYKDTGIEPTASSALQDELDMLQEENESLLEKLRLAEERCEEAEVRARQLEKQIANLGDGVSLEARLLSRKEAALQQREEALKAATQNYGGKGGEVAALRMEAETAKDEAASAFEQLNEITDEFRSLRTMTRRLILTREEMEEVVLKRCWLARYWSLCVRHGIHAEIASARYEYWSAFAPLPVEVVLAAAQRAKQEGCGKIPSTYVTLSYIEHSSCYLEFLSINDIPYFTRHSAVISDAEERENVHLKAELSGEGNVENMLIVDKGLKELTCLKVEEALVIAMAQKRRAASSTSTVTDELRLPIEGKNYLEGFELTEEEQEDVTFKQAWLAYFWRRVKNHGLEPDIAEERLQYWIDRMTRLPISNDAVDAERGLMELKKLAIEIKLWEVSRLSIDPDSAQKTLLEIDK
ncbi:hypothetical protein Leryth_002993 [Lithospermum erythrorhizon]|nr:hypothetical protein Leryth_002993 [Lithospermum erythrorhizon]